MGNNLTSSFDTKIYSIIWKVVYIDLTNMQVSMVRHIVQPYWDHVISHCNHVNLLHQSCDHYKVSDSNSLHTLHTHAHSWFINYNANNGFSSSSFCSFLDLWPVAAAMLGRVSAACALSARNESNSERKQL